jgi:predicted DNA repair protein MutK
MAGSSLFALIDDIATVLDDISVMTKMAARKTAGVLGDDLALNAQQVSGVRAERELPVVWAVAKGSFRNKLILVPAALAVSALAPWTIVPLLMLGGAYLCFEGVEKLAHRWLDPAGEAAHHGDLTQALVDPQADLVAVEQDKIQGAVRTDFVLSAEIIVITLGSVAAAPFLSQVAVLAGIAVIMTVGVYGLVAGIVKLDDVGLYLSQREGQGLAALQRRLGRGVLAAAPWLMKTLSVVGTAAMFLVGGGILSHGIPPLHHLAEGLGQAVAAVPGVGAILAFLAPLILNALVGILAGILVLFGVWGVGWLRRAVSG